MPVKIAMIGAGSVVFCKTLMADIMATPALHGCEFALMSPTEEKLRRMEAFGKRMLADNGLPGSVWATTDRREAIRDADFVVVMIQGVIAAYQRVMGKYPGRWSALASIFVISYVVIDLFTTNTPFHFFVHNLTFSAQSSYNRILIFEYGTAEVKRHPIFGIGMADWTRPSWMSDSMDNYWLLTTVRYGLPAFFMLVGLLLGLIWAVGQRKDLPEEWRRARHGWAFTLFGITVGAATVHLWNAVFVLFLFLIGAGVWLLDAKPGSTMRALGSDDRSRAPVPRLQPARLF